MRRLLFCAVFTSLFNATLALADESFPRLHKVNAPVSFIIHSKLVTDGKRLCNLAKGTKSPWKAKQSKETKTKGCPWWPKMRKNPIHMFPPSRLAPLQFMLCQESFALLKACFMAFLNYHHLRYFRAIAHEGSLTKAARHLKLSQSALSVQLRSLEENLGQQLFERKHKALMLTEAGQIALEYADSIFRSGEELTDLLQNRAKRSRGFLRVGAASNLSRNFQLSFLRPLITRDDVELIIHSGTLRELLAQLQAHTLDVVLSNTPVRRDAETGWHSHLLDEQPVSLVGHKTRGMKPFRFPEDLLKTPIVLPSLESSIRAAFDVLMDQTGIRPIIAAEVDDMAMLRLMARETTGVTLVPPVVVRDELESGTLVERHRFPQIKESFYAITPSRRFPNPILRELMKNKRS